MHIVGLNRRPTKVLRPPKRHRSCSSEGSAPRPRAVQRTGASRFPLKQIQRQQRLAPVADLFSLVSSRAMSDFVPESEIDYDEVYRRGGYNCGDEDFALFRCPFCETFT